MKKLLVVAIALIALVSLTVSSPVLANSFPFDQFSAQPALAVATTTTPVADAYVDSANPSVNTGTQTQIRVDGSPTVRSYLRFTVAGVSGTVSQAILRLYANSALTSGITANRVADTTWSETAINYSNACAVGAAIGTTAAVTAGTWITIDVTSRIHAWHQGDS